MQMIKMLWLSRHEMTEHQLDELSEIFPGGIQIDYCTEQVLSGEEVYLIAKRYDLLGVMLPVHIIGEIFEIRREKQWPIRIIHSVSNLRETGELIINPARRQLEREYAFSHAFWEEIAEAKIMVHRFKTEHGRTPCKTE